MKWYNGVGSVIALRLINEDIHRIFLFYKPYYGVE